MEPGRSVLSLASAGPSLPGANFAPLARRGPMPDGQDARCYAFESAWYSSSGVGLRLRRVVRTMTYPAAATMTAASTGM